MLLSIYARAFFLTLLSLNSGNNRPNALHRNVIWYVCVACGRSLSIQVNLILLVVLVIVLSFKSCVFID